MPGRGKLLRRYELKKRLFSALFEMDHMRLQAYGGK
jgi:hypothetical protein